MKNISILIVVLFVFGSVKAQNQINYYQYLPKEYQLKDANGDLGPSINLDFDNDGINDLAIILFDKNENLPIFCIYLSSIFNTSKTIKYCNWIFMMHSLKYENGVINLFSDNGSMGKYGSLIMKYDNSKKDFKIIKYEDSEGRKSLKFKTDRIS
jgi:hypothetical protein